MYSFPSGLMVDQLYLLSENLLIMYIMVSHLHVCAWMTMEDGGVLAPSLRDEDKKKWN